MLFIVAIGVAVTLIYYFESKSAKDHSDFLRMRRAESERELRAWFAMLEEEDRRRMLSPMDVDWKKEGF